MNSIVCLETINAFVFGFCLICESTFTRRPSDTSVVLGGTVKLECFTIDKTYPPAWSHQRVGSGEKKDVSLVFKQGDLIVPKLVNGYVERHRIVEDRSTGEYSLQITDAKSEDAGIYTCAARGGLAEKQSAELSVFEPYPTCAPNITDVVGENDCHKEPDFVEFSCKFRVHGNYLPKITWTGVSHPKKATIIDAPTTDVDGMASSKLIIKGDYVGLDTTSFRCIVSSTDNAEDNRCTCRTPKIHVLKISNLSESKTLEAPEEVECTHCKGWSKINASGSDWFRRDVDDDSGRQQETHVTSKSLLNLHKREMVPGTYICVANCSIRGELCRVKLIDVSYNPPWGSEPVQSRDVFVAFVLPALVLTIAAAATVLFIWRWKSKNRHSKPKTGSPASSDSSRQNQQGAPLLHELRNGVSVPVTAVPDVKFEGPTNTLLVESDSGNDSSRTPSQQSTSSSQELRNGVSVPINVPDVKFGGPTNTPLVESDSSSDSGLPSDQSTPPISQEKPNHSSIDIPDAKLGGPKKAERIRLLEERAEARMRANAALRRGEDTPTFSEDTDVAEGVAAADKEKHE